jgi:hypothetical protein
MIPATLTSKSALAPALALVLASCASVTRTSSLASEPGRNWVRRSTGTEITVEPAAGGKTSGYLVGATPAAIRLRGADARLMVIPAAPGLNLREPRRGVGAALGGFAGAVMGAILGGIITKSLGRSNPDSAGGVEYPVLVTESGMLVGIVVGVVTGYALGFERRLELRSASSQ